LAKHGILLISEEPIARPDALAQEPR